MFCFPRVTFRCLSIATDSAEECDERLADRELELAARFLFSPRPTVAIEVLPPANAAASRVPCDVYLVITCLLDVYAVGKTRKQVSASSCRRISRDQGASFVVAMATAWPASFGLSDKATGCFSNKKKKVF